MGSTVGVDFLEKTTKLLSLPGIELQCFGRLTRSLGNRKMRTSFGVIHVYPVHSSVFLHSEIYCARVFFCIVQHMLTCNTWRLHQSLQPAIEIKSREKRTLVRVK
jgi:hypothetical protein